MAGLAGTAYHRLDQLILASIRSPSEVGLYAAAVRLAELLSFIASSVVAATTPSLVRIARGGSSENFRDALSDVYVLMIVPGGLGIAVLIATGDRLGPALFGDAFGATGSLVGILALAEIAVFVGSVFTAGLLALQARRAIAVATVSGLVITVAANFALIPGLGAVGAAWASVAGYTTSALVAGLLDRGLRKMAFPVLAVTAKVGIALAIAVSVGRVAGERFSLELLLAGGAYMLTVALMLLPYWRRLFAWFKSLVRSQAVKGC
jgi:O-antigen/teichoic acid export membrane protein